MSLYLFLLMQQCISCWTLTLSLFTVAVSVHLMDFISWDFLENGASYFNINYVSHTAPRKPVVKSPVKDDKKFVESKKSNTPEETSSKGKQNEDNKMETSQDESKVNSKSAAGITTPRDKALLWVYVIDMSTGLFVWLTKIFRNCSTSLCYPQYVKTCSIFTSVCSTDSQQRISLGEMSKFLVPSICQ